MLELTDKQLKALAKRIQDYSNGTFSNVVATTRELGVHVEGMLSTTSGVPFAFKVEANVNIWYIDDIDIVYEKLIKQLFDDDPDDDDPDDDDPDEDDHDEDED